MPIDATIPLQVQPPQVDLLKPFAQAQQLQIQGQQLHGLQLENQQRELTMRSQEGLQKAYVEAGGDLNQTQALALKYGVRAPEMMAFGQHLTALRESLAKLDETELKNRGTKSNIYGGLLAPVMAENDPVKQQALWDEAEKTAVARGVIKPGEITPYPGAEGVRRTAAGLKTLDQLREEITANASADRAKAALQQAGISQEKWNVEKPAAAATSLLAGFNLAGQTVPNNQGDWDTWRQTLPADVQARVSPMYSPSEAQRVQNMGIKPAEQQTLAGAAAARTETSRHNLVEEQGQAATRTETATQHGKENELGRGRLAVERENAARAQKQFDVTYGAMVGPDGKPMDPEAAKAVALQDPLAVAVAGYRTPPPSFTRGGPGSAIMRKVLLINPDYNANMWQAQRDTVNEFSNTSVGKAGGQALALNTLVHHADLWLQAAEALKNGNFRPGNAAYNAVASTFGSAPPTEANLVARFLAGETGKVASGGVPAEGEINGILKNLGNDAGPDQIAAAGKSLLQVAGGRMVPLKERAKAMHVDGIVQVLGPDAEAILRRRGFDPETMKPAAPGAATGAAGIPTLPAKLSKADEGKVFLSPKTGKKLKITAVNPQDGSQFKSVEVK